VPAAGEIVYLRRNANLSSGGTSVDVTGEVHPDNREVAERAARAIGLDIAGVDILSVDISKSLWENGGRICEINSRPGLRSHLWPAVGQPRDVLTPILDMLFPPGRPTRVPVVAVTGNGDTGMAARLLAHLLSTAGHHVGLAVRRRVWSGGRRVGRSRLTPPAAARMILLDPEVDVAVLELRPEEVLRHGLGCDAINIAAVVNGPADAADATVARETLDAIRVVARTTRDVVYVGVADPCADAIAQDGVAAGLSRVVTSARGQRTAAPATGGRRRVVQEGGLITIYDGGRERARVAIAGVLRDLFGAEAAASMQSALYAVVAAHSLGMEPREIDRGLRSFRPPQRRPKMPSGGRPRRRSRLRSP
jgi:cyanophycin synthetase